MMPPTALLETLQAIRRRVKLFAVAFGAGAAVMAAVGLLVGALLLDWLLKLPKGPRAVVLAAALATLAYAILRWLVRPAMSKLSVADVASRLEANFPQFSDRLRSTIDFLRGDVP